MGRMEREKSVDEVVVKDKTDSFSIEMGSMVNQKSKTVLLVRFFFLSYSCLSVLENQNNRQMASGV